jgi:hypothetical protein
VKPPVYDNPVTTGFYDAASSTLFSADCFGALLEDVPERAEDLTEEQLRQSQTFWVMADSPWLCRVDRGLFGRDLDAVRALAPSSVLSSHLPAASGSSLERMLANLEAATGGEPFVGPDQAALEQMLASMGAAPPQ